MTLSWTSNVKREERESSVVEFKLSELEKVEDCITISDVRTIYNLALPSQRILLNLKAYVHLADIPVNVNQQYQPLVLIGLRHWQLMVPLEIQRGEWNDPIAIKTRLG